MYLVPREEEVPGGPGGMRVLEEEGVPDGPGGVRVLLHTGFIMC